MSNLILPAGAGVSQSRRRFVQGLIASSTLMGMGISSRLSHATQNLSHAVTPQILSGTHFDLTYSPAPVNYTGKERYATAINGSVPAPILRWREGDTITINVTNHLAEDTSIHWHGLILPSSQDGVPYVSENFKGIKPGETFTYRFPVKQNGTYWYHSHSGFQEPTGAYGAIIIDPKQPDPVSYDRDHVVLLSDWSDEDPTTIYHKLKKSSDYYNFRQRTLGDSIDEITELGWNKFWQKRGMWNKSRMSDRDISDVTAYTYTYLMNGVTPADGWLGLFKKGEKIRLRFINGSSMTFFDVRIPGLKMTVVAADGQNVEPVTVEEFGFGVGETYDVIVEPKDDRAYTLFAQSIDRTGYALGTLTPNPALKAETPQIDVAPILEHKDMGMNMKGMGHSNHDMSNKKEMKHSEHNMGEMKTMDHSGHDMSNMKGMDHSQHNMMPKERYGSGKAGYGSNRSIAHIDTEYGSHIDMLANVPEYKIDDPGIGLRNSPRRTLVYADLKNLYPTPDSREPEREIDLHLTGNMSRYMWSINGVKFSDAPPLQFKLGERLRINFINDTMMNHPMHLHGMWSDLETGHPDHIPRKHTVIVQPGSKASYLVTADAIGPWAFHCHLVYHMLGMFRKVVVS
jgi:CopA family copper-resistance protein